MSALLLHCDGTNGSTSFPDTGGSNHTVTVTGSAAVDTAQAKFGNASAGLPGSSHLVLDGTGFNFGTGDFTIDFWFRRNGTQGQNNLCTFVGNTATGTDHVIYVSGAGGVLRYFINPSDVITGTTVVTDNAWHHAALTRASGSVRLFLDGTQEGSTFTDNSSYPDGTNLPIFGSETGNGNSLNGWMDEIHVLNGTASWTSNFTPPTSAYADGTGLAFDWFENLSIPAIRRKELPAALRPQNYPPVNWERVILDKLGVGQHTIANGTSFNYTGLTVTAALYNPISIFYLDFAIPTPGVTSVTWNGKPCTQLASQSDTGNQGNIQAWSIRSPDPGNNTLAVSWTTACTIEAVGASFYNVDIASDATAFPHIVTNTGISATPSVTVTTSPGNKVFAGFGVASQNINSVNNTPVFIDNTNITFAGAANYGFGQSSMVMTATPAAAAFWAAIGVDIAFSGVPLFSWFEPLSDIPRYKRMPTALMPFNIGAVNFTIPSFGWFQALSEPARHKIGLLVSQQFFQHTGPVAPIISITSAALAAVEQGDLANIQAAVYNTPVGVFIGITKVT